MDGSAKTLFVDLQYSCRICRSTTIIPMPSLWISMIPTWIHHCRRRCLQFKYQHYPCNVGILHTSRYEMRYIHRYHGRHVTKC